MPLDYMQKDN